MSDIRPYSNILALPLFQGLGRNDLEEVVAHTKFAFSKLSAGKDIIKEGELCDQLKFILNGDVQTEALSDDHSYRIIESFRAPKIIEPERIFGLHQRYSCSYRAINDCNFMSIDKTEIMKLSDKYTIFRINLLNMISTKAQKSSRELWRSVPVNLRQRITRFIEQHCMYPAGEKNIYIKMTRLAEEVNDSRLDVSRALNDMEFDGLLHLHRGRIEIPSMEQLILKS